MNFWQRFFLSVLVWLRLIPKPELVIRLVSEHPDPKFMKPEILYLVGNHEFQKWAYFLCPAKQDEVIQLSLQSNRRPRWEVSSDRLGRPTIQPSVRQLEGSYAHFWVKEGVIDWCADTGKKPMFKAHSREP